MDGPLDHAGGGAAGEAEGDVTLRPALAVPTLSAAGAVPPLVALLT